MERALASYHPIISFLFFFIVICMTMLYMHPVLIGISFMGALIYSIILNKEKTIQTLKFAITMVLVVTVANGLFVHRGVTVLFFINSNPITLESIFYGFTSGSMMASIIMWFSCYNEIITSDKFLYIFGKTLPSVALIVSMTLRLIPKFINQTKIIANSQKTVGLDHSEGSIKMKAKSSMRILSILVTWSLEDAVQTADSMKARGYGLKGRTNFSIYKFIERDMIMLLVMGLAGLFLFMGYLNGYGNLRFYPTIQKIRFDGIYIFVYIAFLIITILPSFLELVEAYKWKYSEWMD